MNFNKEGLRVRKGKNIFLENTFLLIDSFSQIWDGSNWVNESKDLYTYDVITTKLKDYIVEAINENPGAKYFCSNSTELQRWE